MIVANVSRRSDAGRLNREVAQPDDSGTVNSRQPTLGAAGDQGDFGELPEIHHRGAGVSLRPGRLLDKARTAMISAKPTRRIYAVAGEGPVAGR
jgi:hypothetical protein